MLLFCLALSFPSATCYQNMIYERAIVNREMRYVFVVKPCFSVCEIDLANATEAVCMKERLHYALSALACELSALGKGDNKGALLFLWKNKDNADTFTILFINFSYMYLK